jgi:hypothetical protein
MSKLVRKQVYLEVSQDRRVKRRAKAEGIAEAEVIRRAIDLGLDRLGAETLAARGSGRAFFQLVDRLIAEGPLPGGRRWTRDELYDRSRR